jgi:hypothetical protein
MMAVRDEEDLDGAEERRAVTIGVTIWKGRKVSFCAEKLRSNTPATPIFLCVWRKSNKRGKWGERGGLAVVGLPSISLTKEEVKVVRTNPLESVGDMDVG